MNKATVVIIINLNISATFLQVHKELKSLEKTNKISYIISIIITGRRDILNSKLNKVSIILVYKILYPNYYNVLWKTS